MRSDERLAARIHRFTPVAAVVSTLVGIAVLVGWLLDVRTLTQVAPGLVQMKANAAIGFILVGAALWLLRNEHAPRRQHALAELVGALVAVAAALTLAEYLFGTELGIDHLFRDPAATGAPGRPSPHTAIAFLAVGIWLVVLDSDGRAWRWLRSSASVAACIVVLQAALGYLYGVDYLYGIPGAHGMAVHTMATFVVVCFGMLAARPRQSFMSLVSSTGPGGAMARWLGPLVIVLPLLVGLFRLKLQEHGLINTEEGISILVGAIVVVFSALIFVTGRRLDRADAERHELQESLRELAKRDPLTNLFNRRGFEEHLAREVTLGRRHGTPLGLIILDVDRLKEINDRFGHSAGDEVLIGAAEALTTQLRATDVLARLGGDEFAVLLPHTDQVGGEVAARKLVDAGRRVVRIYGGVELRCTMSAGLATNSPDTLDPAALQRIADKALYRAKAGGGDRFEVADPAPVLPVQTRPADV